VDNKHMIALVFSLWTYQLRATPIIFTNQQYDTAGVAIAGAQADSAFDTSPPSPLPLISSATVVGVTDFASGNGIAADGLLTTVAEANSISGFTSAVGTAAFAGSFTGGGLFNILLDLDSQNFTDSSAFSSGTLFLLFISNNVTLLNEAFTANGLIMRGFNLPVGAFNTLELLLSSEASTTAGANAFNLASVAFQFTIPLPSTLLLMLPALLFVCWRSLGRQRAL